MEPCLRFREEKRFVFPDSHLPSLSQRRAYLLIVPAVLPSNYRTANLWIKELNSFLSLFHLENIKRGRKLLLRWKDNRKEAAALFLLLFRQLLCCTAHRAQTFFQIRGCCMKLFQQCQADAQARLVQIIFQKLSRKEIPLLTGE